MHAAVERLVRAHVHRANGHRQALHAFNRALVGLELLFFVGQMAAPTHEQKLTAKQAHAQGAGLQGRLCILRHFDIGQQLHFFAVHGDGRCVEQARQAAAFELDLALFKAVFGQDDGRRVHDDHTGVAVDDDPVVLAHQLAAGACAHHGRNVHAARHDSGVRGFAAHVGNKPGKHALLELQHVGGRQVVRHQHQRHVYRVTQEQVLLRLPPRAARGRHDGRRHAAHGAQDALHNLLHVRLALAQVGVFHLVKLARNHLKLGSQRPLGVVQTVGNPAFDAADQLFVLQQHQMHIQQGVEFMGRLFGAHEGNTFLQPVQLFDHSVATGTRALDFGAHLMRLDKVVRHVHPARRHHHRAANGHAA